MTVALGVMGVPAPVAGDSLRRYETGALPDGGLWTALRRLSDHDHSGGQMGAPVAGAEVTITTDASLVAVESPADTFALSARISPDAGNALSLHSGGLFATGGGGADATYVHVQSTASATWTVGHNLGKYPSVSVVDTGGTTVIPDVHYDSPAAVTLTFGAPTSGQAFCN
jgi:hypothetical protein